MPRSKSKHKRVQHKVRLKAKKRAEKKKKMHKLAKTKPDTATVQPK
jgi:hypothetical protein